MWKIQRHYVLTILGFFGVLWLFTQRLNISVAIVAMVKSPEANGTITIEQYAGEENQITNMGEFDWDIETQGIVLGSFFYGYFVTQLPGGILAQKFGGKNVFGVGIGMTSLLTVLSPPSARIDVGLFIFVRLVQGMFGGLILASLPILLGKWTPPAQKTKLMSFIISGSSMGVIVAQTLSGVLSASDFLGGWPSAFYVMGFGGMISFVLWMALVSENPPHYGSDSSEKKLLIDEGTKRPERVLLKHVPWKNILTSVPVWAMCCAQTSSAWGQFTMMSFLPTYMNQVLHFDIEKNGALSSLPYVSALIASNIGGCLSDWLLERRIFTTGTVRKLMTGISGIGMSVFSVTVGYTTHDVTLNIAIICLALFFYGFILPGVYINSLDIAPKYSGAVFGISNTFTNIPGFLAPMVTAWIIGDEPSVAEWRIVFWVTAGINIFGTVVFILFASGREQTWAMDVTVDSTQQLSTDPVGDVIPDSVTVLDYGSTTNKVPIRNG